MDFQLLYEKVESDKRRVFYLVAPDPVVIIVPPPVDFLIDPAV
jgi:hypothetical protein